MRREWAGRNRPSAEGAKDVRYDFWQRHEKRQREQVTREKVNGKMCYVSTVKEKGEKDQGKKKS